MKKGSIVECVNDQFESKHLKRITAVPVKGKLYIVRGRPLDFASEAEGPGVLLEELVNPHSWFKIGDYRYLLEPRFRQFRFREVMPPADLTELLKESEEEAKKIK